MTTKTINLYTFDELSEAAKEKARNWWREASCGDSYWSESVEEDAKSIGKLMGFEIETIPWSGFASQGDGACIEGIWESNFVTVGGVKDYAPVDTVLHKIAESLEALAGQFPTLRVKITHNDRYSHERSVDYDFYFHDQETGEEIDWPDAFKEGEFKELARDFMRWIYRQLEKEYEYQNSDECVDENITANDYTFEIDGTRED